MVKLQHRLLALLLCAMMLFTTAGFTFAGDGHDHEHAQEALQVVLSAPLPPVALFSVDGGDGVTPTEPPATDSGDSGGTDSGNTGGSGGGEQGSDTETTPSPAPTPGTANGDVCPSGPNGQHHWISKPLENFTECSGASGVQVYCEYCNGTRGTAKGTHTWGEWSGTGIGCVDYTQTRTCIKCGAQETRTVSGSGHKWKQTYLAATCTTGGYTRQQCSVCGTIQNEVSTPALGHRPAVDDGDCTTELKCIRCGDVVTPAQSHNWGSSWSYDNVNHWHACTNAGCTAKTDVEKHNGTLSADCTKLSNCSTCGIKSANSGMSHNFDGTVYTRVSSTGHAVRCSNAGCMISQDNVPHTADPSTGQSCTEAVKCVCGYTMTAAQKGHSYGAWTGTAAGHSHSCTRCGAVESATHTGSGSTNICTNAITCTTCGYVLSPGYSSHSYGVWYATGTGHARVCIHPGCSTTQTAAHTGGTANCVSGAVCTACGATYGAKAAGNHTGGTELRNAKPAEVGVAGYTGDTYCLGCGKLITKGSTIKALTGDHTHSFTGAWKRDSATHWHECSCGERSEEAFHSFSDGKCTVCGVADPNYKTCSGSSHVGGTELRDAKPAGKTTEGYTGDTYCLTCGKLIAKGSTIKALEESHTHSYTGGWRSDSVSHWHECSCGLRGNVVPHSFSNDRCTVCGATDPNGKLGDHAHTYGTWVTNGQDHWRECTVCGEQADRSVHVMLNDKCIECGMAKADVSVYTDVKEKDTHYDAIKQVVEAGLMSGVSDKEFKPEEQLDRATLADVLYRLAGSPAASKENIFTDVPATEAYAQAVSWVTAADIMDADGEIFDPQRTVTLQELITLLWRFAAQQEMEVKGDAKALSAYSNKDEVESWAEDAMAWALAVNLLDGLDEEQVLPTVVVTRAETAVIAARFLDLVEAMNNQAAEAAEG